MSDRLQQQLDLFMINPETDLQEIVQKNKTTITELLNFLISRKLVDGTNIEDYQMLNEGIDGGFGKVFKACLKNQETSKTKDYKAIKCVNFSLFGKLFFIKEIELMMKMKHRNVVKIEKLFFSKTNLYGVIYYTIHIVMPWIDQSLLSWMTNSQDRGYIYEITKNIRSFDEVRNMLTSILKGINAIHLQNIIHLDIKFDNILVKEVDEEENTELNFEKERNDQIVAKKTEFEAVIIDLGLGKKTSRISSSFSGTPQFIAPEIFEFVEKYENASSVTKDDLEKENGNLIDKSAFFTPKADIYSFGVMLYKIFIKENGLINKLLIKNEKIKQRISEIFPNDQQSITQTFYDDIEDILLICLENEVSNRPHASSLVFDHPFFNSSISKCPKQYLQIQKTQNNASNSIGAEENQKLPIKTQNNHSFDEEFSKGLNYLEGKNEYPKDLKKAREIFQNLSKSDNNSNAASSFVMGWMLRYGLGGNVDVTKGKEIMANCGSEAKTFFETYFEDENLGFFSFFIGYIYLSGIKDHGKAIEYFEKSSQKSNSFAFEILGLIHKIGWEHFAKSSQKSNSFAYDKLGLVHQNGWGFPKNHFEAFNFYKFSAELGNCIGQFNVGWMYERGTGTKQDYELAAKFYQLSADQGYPDAQNRLGHLFAYGFGVKTDKVKATQLYKLAADQGSAVGQFNFANNCEDGDATKKDYELAAKYYQLSVDQGYESAQNSLGFLYDNGFGVKTDKVKATQLYKLAADQGSAVGQFNFALASIKGDGIAMNTVVAKDYFEKAAAQGHENAKNALKELEQQM